MATGRDHLDKQHVECSVAEEWRGISLPGESLPSLATVTDWSKRVSLSGRSTKEVKNHR